jgi:hypothetical protein
MARVIFVRAGGTDDCPLYAPEDACDLKACNGQRVIVADVKGERSKRTALQNRSIHKYWSLICEALNDAGWTKKKYFQDKEVDIGWTAESIGDDIWRGIQDAMYGHRNTSKLETHQVSKVYEIMSKHLATTCPGIDQSFPNRHGD